MATWDIDVPMASQVLAQSGDLATGYEADVAAAAAAVQAAVGALATSPFVLGRVGEFAESVTTPHLDTVVGHTASALQGTSTALSSYVAGDLEMAAEAQRNATLATYPQDVPGQGGRGQVPR